jgi:hypothetical protein
MVAAAGEMVPLGSGVTVTTELLEAGPLQVPEKICAVYVPAVVAL